VSTDATEQTGPTDASAYRDEAQPDQLAGPHCSLPPEPMPDLPTGLGADRLHAIVEGRTKWVNGTVLHYYFFDRDTDGQVVRFSDGTSRFVTWVGPEAQRDAVRAAFQTWKDLGIGLEFDEVDDRQEAEVRVGFMEFDGSWSAVGRDVLRAGANSRTTNYGWDLRTPYGRTTALHEIGHVLGMPHEHQNPYAGITWDEPKVYAYFEGPPNEWDRDTTFRNVLQKLSTFDVQGSTWDPDSIMEYWFPSGLILTPTQYRAGINPPGTISALDEQYVASWYPSMGAAAPPTLTAFESRALDLKAGEQVDFTLSPPGTRWYSIGTLGASDTVVVLFENVNGQLRYVAGDDDSGTDRNALIEAKLFQGRTYVVRVRLYYSWKSGHTAVMYW
jgi:Astacin (Peptidase family M12A)